MSLETAETEIPKRLAVIGKLPKAELTADKIKFVKDCADILKRGKEFQKSRDEMNKRIKDAKKLVEDIKKWEADWAKFISESVKLSQLSNKIKPDTSSRDFFMVANYLSTIGGKIMLDDFP